MNRRVQYFAAFAVSLTTMTNGASFFWTAPILPKFYNNEIIANITSTEISWVVSIFAIGMIIGGMVASSVSDKAGRRATLLISAFPFIIGTVFVLCATNTWMLYIARTLWGCGAGMISTVSSIYLSEIADKDIRGTLTAGSRFMFNVGAIIVLSIGSYLTYSVLSCLLIALPVSYLLVCWWIPETPYYLLKEGKIVAARTVIQSLSGCKDEKVIEAKLNLMRSDVRKEMAISGSAKELFTRKQYRRAVIVAVGLKVTQLLSGSNPIQQYLGKIIQQSNCGMQISTALSIFGVIRLIVGLISPFIVDKVGRRPLLICTYLTASIFLAIIGSYFFIQQVTGLINMSSNPFRYIVFVGVVSYTIIANIGFDTLIFIIPSEIFPLNVKSIAMTFLNIFTALISFIIVRGYQIMEDFMGLYGVFWFYSIMAFCGAVFTYYVVPETKGKSLRQIQIELQGNIYDESSEKLKDLEENLDEIKNIAYSVIIKSTNK